MDRFDDAKRSAIMSAVGGRNTKPEIFVRKLLFSAGYRYRINSTKLIGKPDIVLSKHKVVVFVHGCFWHMHAGCSRSSVPESKREFWEHKLRSNVERDRIVSDSLIALGWRVLIVWECACQKRWSMKLLSEMDAFIRNPDEVRREIGKADLADEPMR